MKFQSFIAWGIALGCFFLIRSGISLEANQVRLSGQVTDAATRSPLKGADIYLVRSQVGTISDADGYFSLILKAIQENDTLVVGFVGYREYRIALKDFKNRSRIELQPVSIELPDSVLVRGERIDLVQQEIPHARDVVDFQTIEIRGSSEISDLFKTIPSVRVEGNDLTGRRIQIRGSNAGEVNVYVDGILLNSLGEENAADLSVIPTENIEKMEVLKGANLTLLGSGAFGGVVNVTTQKSLERSLLLKTKQGSFNTQYYIAEVNFPISRRFVVNYFGQYSGIEPGIEYFPGEFADSGKTENQTVESTKQNHNLALNYYTGRGEWSARFYGYLLDYEKLSADNQPLQNFRKNYLLSGAYTGNLLGINNMDMRLNYLLGDDEIRRDRVSEGGSDRFVNAFESRRLNARLTKKFDFGLANEVQLLGEYFHDEVETDVRQTLGGQDYSIYNALLYENRFSAAGVVAFSNQFQNRSDITWKTHFGMRDDYVVTGDNYLAPTVGIQVDVEKTRWTFSPYLNYGKNIKFQTLLENARNALSEVSGADTLLVRLKPEESNAGEIGVGVTYDPASEALRDVDFKLAVFRNVVFNKLVWIPGFGVQQFEQSQIGRNVTKGLEGSIALNKIARDWDLIAVATLLDIEYPSLYPFKPESMFSLQTLYSGDWGGYFSATFFYEGQSTAVILNEFTQEISSSLLEPFFDIDLSLGYRFRVGRVRLNLQAAGYNILDNSGFQYYLLKKQYFQVSLAAKI